MKKLIRSYLLKIFYLFEFKIKIKRNIRKKIKMPLHNIKKKNKISILVKNTSNESLQMKNNRKLENNLI